MPLTNDTTLMIADGVRLVRSSDVWDVENSNRRLRGNRYTLAILDVFSTPNSFREGTEQVASRFASTPAWIEIVANIKALYQSEILVDVERSARVRRVHSSRFDSAPVHIKMLDDRERTRRFQEAVRRTVTPDDVVLDIGTGTGVLALTAALAGARHVYALEATAMSRVAQRMVDANGLGDRVTVLESHSFDVELPERANVLVSEIIGDDPLGEQILPTFEDARRRLLAGHARSVPASLRIDVLPVEVPAEVIERFRFTHHRARAWSERYGLDFRSLVSASDEYDHRVKLNTYETRGWKRLSHPVTVADVDLLHAASHMIDASLSLVVNQTGSVSGMLILFDADLGPGVRLSVHPDVATPSNSWGSVLQLLAQPLEVAPGEELQLRYRFDDRGSRIDLARAL